MKSVDDRLAAIMAGGVVFRIDGGKLYAKGGALTDGDRAWIAAHKPAIIAALEAWPLLAARDWADALPEAQALARQGAARIAWERADIAAADPPLTAYELAYGNLILDIAAALVDLEQSAPTAAALEGAA
jgi:hypothetical protein